MKTLKNTILLICAMFLFSTAQSQSIFNEKDITGGVALGVTAPYGLNPSLGLKINGEYGIAKVGPGVISGGAIIGITSYKYTYYTGFWGTTSASERVLAIYIGGKGAYHWSPDEEKMDLYGGVVVGGVIGTDSRANISRFDPGAFVGINYYFSENIAVNGEVGYAFTLLSGGLTFSF